MHLQKRGAALYGDCDVVLTFEELEAWMEEAGVQLEATAPEAQHRKKARFFPIKGGVLRTMHTDEDTGYTYLAVDGVQNCIAALKEIEAGNLTHCSSR